jgi:hypothetical protein
MRICALPVLVALGMAGCGGGGGSDGKGMIAAKACEESARQQLAGKTFEMDVAVLAASDAQQPDGTQLLKAPITIEPGLASESKQTLECSVRFVDNKAAPDVLRVQFIW